MAAKAELVQVILGRSQPTDGPRPSSFRSFADLVFLNIDERRNLRRKPSVIGIVALEG